jgi:hypothetical protein
MHLCFYEATSGSFCGAHSDGLTRSGCGVVRTIGLYLLEMVHCVRCPHWRRRRETHRSACVYDRALWGRLRPEKEWSDLKGVRVMIGRSSRTLALVLAIATLPAGLAFAQSRGGAGGFSRGGGLGGGVGAFGTGSAAVGGGAGAVGGGAPAGAIGGGLPGAGNPAGNGSAGAGNPRLNSGIAGSIGNGSNAPGIAFTRREQYIGGGYVGYEGAFTGAASAPNGITRAAAPASSGGMAPAASGSNESTNKESSPPTEPSQPRAGEGVAQEAPFSPDGLVQPSPDGMSTVTVAARPCSAAAHETDGTTTCIGIPRRRR